MKTNTFSMAISKTYCLFHFQNEICIFFIFLHIVNIWPPKKCNLPANIFEDFSYGTLISENIKEIINGIYYRIS